MLCCCWCFCTSDAFHSKIRNDSSDQVCVPAYLCIYIERDVLAYIYLSLSPFIHLFIYVFMYLFYFLFYVSICINPQLAHCL